MKKYVQISNSGSTIVVTPDLRCINATNFKNPAGDRLSIKPAWMSTRITIKRGIHYYPIQIKNWNTVKALDFLVIGAEVEDCNEPEAKAMYEQLARADEKYNHDLAVNKKNIAKDEALAEEITKNTIRNAKGE